MDSLRHKNNQQPAVELSSPDLSAPERVKRWIHWAENHPKNSPGLPDVALSRDSIYG